MPQGVDFDMIPGKGKTLTNSPRRISRADDAIAWANWCRSRIRGKHAVGNFGEVESPDTKQQAEIPCYIGC
jgi:hypothetical protein